MSDLSIFQIIAVAIIPVLFAITVHEVAHGWVAKQFGDPTAERLGRLTLNPLKHIDPIGTVALPLFFILMTGIAFGWAKPVPITWQNLRHPKRDMTFVAAAGPGANLIMALIWALLYKISLLLEVSVPWVASPLMLMAYIGIFINLLLLFLNLIPVPPLDGGRVAVGLLPGPWAWQLSRLEPYGIFIIVGLLMLDYAVLRTNYLFTVVDKLTRFLLGS